MIYDTITCVMPRRNYPKNTSRKKHIPPHIALETLDIACRAKRHFSTEKQANNAAEAGMLANMQLELDTYQCAHCHGWHLTSKGKR